MLDTLRQVETPEGVELSLPVAGPVLRARAWFFDLLIQGALVIVAGIVLAMLDAAGAGIFMVFVFLLAWLYPVLFEVLRGGATPGKQIVGLRVVHDDGMPVGWSAALLRSLVGFVDMLPVGYAVGLVASSLNRDSKRLGDMAAGTVVVHHTRAVMRTVRVDLQPQRPRAPLRVDEQQGLVEFASRAPRLTPDRLRELARLAAPLGGDEPDGVTRLLAQARWISGDR